MVCRFSIIDIAKVESLSSNARLCGSLLCLTIASQLIIQGLFIDRYIYYILSNMWSTLVADQCANIGTCILLWQMLIQEQEEVKNLKNKGTTRIHKEFMQGKTDKKKKKAKKKQAKQESF